MRRKKREMREGGTKRKRFAEGKEREHETENEEA